MAEHDDGQERTEEPSARRLEQARERGDVPRSRDLGTAALLLGAGAAVMVLAPFIAEQFETLARAAWQLPPEAVRAPDAMSRMLWRGLLLGVLAGAPVLIVLAVAAFVSSVALGGLTFSAEALGPKFERLDPVAGLGRMFSMKSLVELAKATLKLVVVGVPVVLILSSLADQLLALNLQNIRAAIVHAVALIGWGFIGMAAATALIALFDVPWQLYQYADKLKMSFQELKEEAKDTDGRPEVKGRIRRLQQEMARKRMLADVPTADVIITNPEHYAVALKYDSATMGAPRVLAKGADFMAARIRQVATESGVTIVQTPALARAVYYSSEVGGEIHKGLYLAVARVLAYVLQLTRHRNGLGTAPVWPDDLPIPDDLKHD